MTTVPPATPARKTTPTRRPRKTTDTAPPPAEVESTPVEPDTAPDAAQVEHQDAGDPAPAAAPLPADAAPAAPATPAAAEEFTERDHKVLDAMGVPEDRAGRVLLWRAWKRTGLDPFDKQIYLRQDHKIIRGGTNAIGNKVEERVPVYTVGTTIAGFRIVANRQPNYQGQTPVQWCADDGQWRDVWLGGRTPPYAARVGVFVEGHRLPEASVAIYAEYKSESSMWTKMPAHMIGIAAEALSIRRAYPDKLSGIYTDEELHQREDAADLTAATPAAAAETVPDATSSAFNLVSLAASALAAVRGGADPQIVWGEAAGHRAGNLLPVYLADENATLAEVLRRSIDTTSPPSAPAAAVPAQQQHPADDSDSAGRCESCRHRLTLAQIQFGDVLCVDCLDRENVAAHSSRNRRDLY